MELTSERVVRRFDKLRIDLLCYIPVYIPTSCKEKILHVVASSVPMEDIKKKSSLLSFDVTVYPILR